MFAVSPPGTGIVDVTVTTPDRHQRDQRSEQVHLQHGGPDGDIAVAEQRFFLGWGSDFHPRDRLHRGDRRQVWEYGGDIIQR